MIDSGERRQGCRWKFLKEPSIILSSELHPRKIDLAAQMYRNKDIKEMHVWERSGKLIYLGEQNKVP